MKFCLELAGWFVRYRVSVDGNGLGEDTSNLISDTRHLLMNNYYNAAKLRSIKTSS